MKTEIEEIKKIIANCEKMLGEIESELLKESKPEFKVGDWVVEPEFKIIDRVGRVEGDTICYDDGMFNYKNDLRHATIEEIKEHLIKEAEERGLVEGVKYKCTNTGSIEQRKGDLEYYEEADQLTDGNGGSVYLKGKWAEVIKDMEW